MKIFISSDIEGTTGIVNWNETEKGTFDYNPIVKQMSLEVKAACEGANKGGAREILVKDAHDSACNIDPNMLPENASILRGWTKNPYVMMAGIDESFDAAIFTGYHVGTHSNGNPLAHTMSSSSFSKYKINGKGASELHINAYIAAMFGVPLVCVTGDEEVCREAKELNPNIHTVPVLKGIGNASISMNPKLALKKIEETVEEAVKGGDLDKYKIELPEKFETEIEFKEHYRAYRASFYPGVKLVDSKTISYTTENFYDFLTMCLFIG